MSDGTVTEPMPTIDDLDDLVELVERSDGSHGPFLRYSRGPAADEEAGPSVDYEAGVQLPGWAVTTVKPERWWDRPARDWVARRVCKYRDAGSGGDDIRPWLLSASVVGTGPDHEPLVSDMTPVAWLGDRLLEQAEEVYRGRFDVGRDSS
jgi:hypothetical protein